MIGLNPPHADGVSILSDCIASNERSAENSDTQAEEHEKRAAAAREDAKAYRECSKKLRAQLAALQSAARD